MRSLCVSYHVSNTLRLAFVGASVLRAGFFAALSDPDTYGWKHGPELLVAHGAVAHARLAEQQLRHGRQVCANDLELGCREVGRQQLFHLLERHVAHAVRVQRVEDEPQLLLDAHVQLQHRVDQVRLAVDHALLVVVAVKLVRRHLERLRQRRAVQSSFLVGHARHRLAQHRELRHGRHVDRTDVVLRETNRVLGFKRAVAENRHRHDVATRGRPHKRRLGVHRRESLAHHGGAHERVDVWASSASSVARGGARRHGRGRAVDLVHHELVAAEEARGFALRRRVTHVRRVDLRPHGAESAGAQCVLLEVAARGRRRREVDELLRHVARRVIGRRRRGGFRVMHRGSANKLVRGTKNKTQSAE
ncbi:hypothetical protein PINS_up000241 [Pythium insidiosum]|nr:hypothetical protein PINS_up000241 [Pythium insidiosum]